MIYADTSFLLSLFIADSGSEAATSLVNDAGGPLVWSAWHELEFTCALEARVGRRENTKAEAEGVYGQVRACQRGGFFRKPEPRNWMEILERGVSLSREHGATFLNRSLDVLHVVLCLSLGLRDFWTLDQRQRALAERVGLEVNPLLDLGP